MSNPQEIGKSLFDELPKYRSHKVVAAAQIKRVHVVFGRPQLHLSLSNSDTAHKIEVPRDWYDHNKPKVGDWLICGNDGYLSVSPHVAFAEGYHADGVAALAGWHPNWQMAEASPAEARTCGCGPSACPDHKESHSEPEVPAEGFDAASVLAVLLMAAVVAAGAAWWMGWLA